MAAMAMRLHPLPFINPSPIPPRRALLLRPLLPSLALAFPRLRSPLASRFPRVNAVDSGAENSGGGEDKEDELRGRSTMPDRFRYLTKEVPDRPIRWPWFIGMKKSCFLL